MCAYEIILEANESIKFMRKDKNSVKMQGMNIYKRLAYQSQNIIIKNKLQSKIQRAHPIRIVIVFSNPE